MSFGRWQVPRQCCQLRGTVKPGPGTAIAVLDLVTSGYWERADGRSVGAGNVGQLAKPDEADRVGQPGSRRRVGLHWEWQRLTGGSIAPCCL
jgi:hypothetical protein